MRKARRECKGIVSELHGGRLDPETGFDAGCKLRRTRVGERGPVGETFRGLRHRASCRTGERQQSGNELRAEVAYRGAGRGEVRGWQCVSLSDVFDGR